MSTLQDNWKNFKQGRKPPKDGRYLVYLINTENSGNWGGNNIEIANYSNGIWINTSIYPAPGLEGYVSHWCELPEPPV